MPVRARLRQALRVAVAINMALALLHGPSMAFADTAGNALHLSPHHSEAQKPHHHHATQEEPDTPPSHQDHGAGAMPGCPLATFAAVQSLPAATLLLGSGEAIDSRLLQALTPADPLLADPPPRPAAI